MDTIHTICHERVLLFGCLRWVMYTCDMKLIAFAHMYGYQPLRKIASRENKWVKSLLSRAKDGTIGTIHIHMIMP